MTRTNLVPRWLSGRALTTVAWGPRLDPSSYDVDKHHVRTFLVFLNFVSSHFLHSHHPFGPRRSCVKVLIKMKKEDKYISRELYRDTMSIENIT